MKTLAAILAVAALPMLGGCTVYGTGPAGNAAWANYDHTYDYGHKGYDRPVIYGNSFGFTPSYGGGAYGGVQADIDVGGGYGDGYYDSYYGSGY